MTKMGRLGVFVRQNHLALLKNCNLRRKRVTRTITKYTKIRRVNIHLVMFVRVVCLKLANQLGVIADAVRTFFQHCRTHTLIQFFLRTPLKVNFHVPPPASKRYAHLYTLLF